MVQTDILTPGQAQFQCTGCQSFFAFNWPLPPDSEKVQTLLINRELEFVKAPEPPKAQATVPPVPSQTCFRCGVKSAPDLKECPKCGVVFEKVKTMKSSQKVIASTIQVAWEQLANDYSDGKKHEAFVQLCLSQENLAFASQQYRSVLAAQPHDEIAKKMQERIVQMAAVTYLASRGEIDEKPRWFGLTKFGIVLAFLLIGTGLFSPYLRSLIAVGCSILVFIIAVRYFARQV